MRETEEIEDESEEWLYNYYGKERINQIKAAGREEGRRKGREEEKQKNVLHLLQMRYSIKRIKAILQLSEDEILRIAKANNVVVP
ncbi:MAG: hypothetical protein J6T06_03715 [Victivallales bacterium]|nr:hypothetical protein [Victivallales bacterium]